ncbi:hypothetical protein FNJ84_07975 [Paracoccus sp. M683]|uniref:hypothetical protein n=1 Tax=Paracoccus sp. M683 TaxID=2594268 RepID=UPI00117CBE88|nr:hypothetical protein [Paracoccus sp. M683]TRW97442.1 hypothetical protein FNJ84_07975 [Paracoccus sp. M683]
MTRTGRTILISGLLVAVAVILAAFVATLAIPPAQPPQTSSTQDRPPKMERFRLGEAVVLSNDLTRISLQADLSDGGMRSTLVTANLAFLSSGDPARWLFDNSRLQVIRGIADARDQNGAVATVLALSRGSTRELGDEFAGATLWVMRPDGSELTQLTDSFAAAPLATLAGQVIHVVYEGAGGRAYHMVLDAATLSVRSNEELSFPGVE